MPAKVIERKPISTKEIIEKDSLEVKLSAWPKGPKWFATVSGSFG